MLIRNAFPTNTYRAPLERLFFVAVTALITTIIACSRVPVTDRRQLNLLPASQLQEMSYQQYQSFLEEHEVSDNQKWQDLVKTVGKDIKLAVEDYLRQTGDSEHTGSFDWTFTLIESDQQNAFAMPGGKVVLYEGIVEVADGNRAQVATIMAHEIAHVIANHGNERMSQQLLQQLGGAALDSAVNDKSPAAQKAFMTAYGLGSQIGVLLPFSRTQESEADELGLVFMANAGYDPRSAIEFWQNMRAAADGGSPPEFLSTHPGHDARIADIQDHMPRALEIYRANASR